MKITTNESSNRTVLLIAYNNENKHKIIIYKLILNESQGFAQTFFKQKPKLKNSTTNATRIKAK